MPPSLNPNKSRSERKTPSSSCSWTNRHRREHITPKKEPLPSSPSPSYVRISLPSPPFPYLLGKFGKKKEEEEKEGDGQTASIFFKSRLTTELSPKIFLLPPPPLVSRTGRTECLFASSSSFTTTHKSLHPLPPPQKKLHYNIIFFCL